MVPCRIVAVTDKLRKLKLCWRHRTSRAARLTDHYTFSHDHAGLLFCQSFTLQPKVLRWNAYVPKTPKDTIRRDSVRKTPVRRLYARADSYGQL